MSLIGARNVANAAHAHWMEQEEGLDVAEHFARALGEQGKKTKNKNEL